MVNVSDVTLSKHMSLIYIRPKCERRHIIYTQVTDLYTSLESETSHYLSTGHSFIYVLSVRDVALSKHRLLYK
jgi:hypothetical protein